MQLAHHNAWHCLGPIFKWNVAKLAYLILYKSEEGGSSLSYSWLAKGFLLLRPEMPTLVLIVCTVLWSWRKKYLSGIYCGCCSMCRQCGKVIWVRRNCMFSHRMATSVSCMFLYFIWTWRTIIAILSHSCKFSKISFGNIKNQKLQMLQIMLWLYCFDYILCCAWNELPAVIQEQVINHH